MNDSLLDAQLRAALLEEPMPDNADTREALAVVLARSRRRPARRRVAALSVLAAAAAVVAVVAVPAVLLDDRLSPPPPAEPPAVSTPFVGTWERTVTDEAAGLGPWTMDLRSNGVVGLDAPADAPETDGVSYTVSGGQLRTDAFVNNVCAEQPAGVYRWSVSGVNLLLVALSEPCAVRASVFDGTWTRAGE